MIRIALIALAGMSAACSTQTYDAPYGQEPYGYPDPNYPAAPYPGNLPPPGYPAAGQQPVPAPCPIASSRDWRAWINAMPGPDARPKLMVTGTVVAPTGGHQFRFEPFLQIRESYPAQAFATLEVIRPQGAATQALVTHDLRWEWPVDQQLGSLEIRCGGDTLATISPIETAH